MRLHGTRNSKNPAFLVAGESIELRTSWGEIVSHFKQSPRLFCSQEDLDVVQSISADFSVQKDAEQAAKCRERGNYSFKTKDYTTAALHYSQVRENTRNSYSIA